MGEIGWGTTLKRSNLVLLDFKEKKVNSSRLDRTAHMQVDFGMLLANALHDLKRMDEVKEGVLFIKGRALQQKEFAFLIYKSCLKWGLL